MRCINESEEGTLGTILGIIPIKNVKVKITSTVGSITETGYTNKNGYCYFNNIPTNIKYVIEATHIYWSQEKVEWMNNFALVYMNGGRTR